MHRLLTKFFHHFSNKPDYGKSNLLNVRTGILSGLVIGLAVSILYYANFFEKLEAISMDFRFQFRQNPPLSKDLVVVGISKECIDHIGGYPISRNIYAKVIDYIHNAGAKSIAFDIFFDLPSTEKSADLTLSKSIKSASSITLPIFSAQKVETLPVVDNMFRTKIMRQNLDILTEASVRQGHINILPGSDGKIRYVPAVFQYNNNYVFPMAMEAYLQFKNIPHDDVIVHQNELKIKGQRVHLTSKKALLVNYFNPANAIDFLHLEMPGEKFANGINFFYFKDVLKGAISPTYFKDKLVLIGQTCHGFSNSDEYITPFDVMFGAFIQASVINSFLTDNFVYRLEPIDVILSIIILSVMVGFLFSILSFPRAGIACGTVFLIGYIISFWFFNTKGLIIETIPLSVATFVNFSLHLIKRFQYAFKVILEKEVELGIISSAGEKLLDIYRVSDTPEMVINNITESISVDTCLLYICENNNNNKNEISLKAEKSANYSGQDIHDELIEMMKQLNKEIRINKDPILINNFNELAEANDAIDTGIKSLLIVPLIVHQEIIGIICLCNKWNIYKKAPDNFSNDDLKLLKSLLMQSAISLENYLLYNNMQELLMNSIKALVAAIEAKDQYTAGHSERVTAIAVLIGQELGLAPKIMENLRVSAILHDVGKIGISEKILCSKERLTDEEFAVIKSHPSKGATILQHLDEFSAIIPGVKHHHERYDGRGYPDNIKGENIPLPARIIAIADTFDAITSNRTYRRKKNFQFAVDEITKCAGTQFDPEMVEAFLSCYSKYHNVETSPLYNEPELEEETVATESSS